MKKVLLPILVINPILIGGVAFYQLSSSETPLSEINFNEAVLNSQVADAQTEEAEKENTKKGVIPEAELALLSLSKSPFDIPAQQKAALEKEEAVYEAILRKEAKEKSDLEQATLDLIKEAESGSSVYGYNEFGEFVNLSETQTESPAGTKEDNPETTKQKVESTVLTITNKYKVDKNIIISLIEELSGYDVDLEKNSNGVKRVGLMQLRADKTTELMESIGLVYNASQVKDISMNIEMGTAYIKRLLDKSDNNLEFALTAFYHGEEYAESIFLTTESYKTEFSESITKKIFKLNN